MTTTPTVGTSHLNTGRSTLRGIALFEALKGFVALLSGLGLISLLHRDLHQLALELIGHFGLDPAQHFPAQLLRYVDVLNGTPLGTLELLLASYVAVRLTEAYGLWRERAWGEWLGALSGGLYIPFELRHLWHEPAFINAGVLLLNLAMVVFLAAQLKRRGGPQGQGNSGRSF